MRIISLLLIIFLLLPLMPIQSSAQLLLNPADMSGGNGIQPIVVPADPARSPAEAFSSSYVSLKKISDDYLLGPGDRLAAFLVVGDNALSLDYSFIVNPEGKIFFPNIGEIDLYGLNLKEAKAKMSRKIRSKYRERFTLSLMLTDPKKIKIYVTGQVANPGIHTVYGWSRVSEVVKAVGIASGGSKRNVIIKRDDEIINVDLYEIYYGGNVDKDITVEMGDVLEIPVMGSARVTIMGEVPRPGQYELENKERLKDALAMAGYVGVNSALSKVAYLKRKKGEDDFENRKLNLYSMLLEGDDAQNIELSDGDIISIPAIKAYVYVYGEVGKGGRFEYKPGLKLSDYLNLAGGPTDRANLSGTTVTRPGENNPKVYHINASDILHRGITNNDIEILAGDVINVPSNFFYFADFASFANTVLLGLTLYSAFVK
jgi:protein involved in polysaccharide export with SLBB domain